MASAELRAAALRAWPARGWSGRAHRAGRWTWSGCASGSELGAASGFEFGEQQPGIPARTAMLAVVWSEQQAATKWQRCPTGRQAGSGRNRSGASLDGPGQREDEDSWMLLSLYAFPARSNCCWRRGRLGDQLG